MPYRGPHYTLYRAMVLVVGLLGLGTVADRTAGMEWLSLPCFFAIAGVYAFITARIISDIRDGGDD